MPNINDLPLEIFGLILESLHVDMTKREREVDIGLAAVCLTCKLWKDFAFSTPKLWSYIEIINNGFKILPSNSKVSKWLGRSKNQPLSLVVKNFFQCNLARALLKLLVAHSHRWHRIYLRFSPYFGGVELPDNFLAPILESVIIDASCMGFNINVFYEKLLRGAASLRNFVHHGHWDDFSPIGLHLEPLRCFDLESYLSASDALMTLEKGINLRTCSLRIGGCDVLSAKPVTSSVVCLRLLVVDVDSAKEFFEFLDAQSLTNLTIIFSGWWHNRDTLFYILSKTHSQLSTLTITNINMTADEFLIV